MQTLVRVFYNNQQILGIVIPDDDSQLDAHKSITGDDERYLDLPNEIYRDNMLENGLPDNSKLLTYVLGLENK
jgi:hypothetical protein